MVLGNFVDILGDALEVCCPLFGILAAQVLGNLDCLPGVDFFGVVWSDLFRFVACKQLLCNVRLKLANAMRSL